MTVTVAIFIRSDIFTKIVERAAEPDKLAYVRLKWEDPAILLRIIEARYEASHEAGSNPEMMWKTYFCASVAGTPIKKYLADTILPRPRDIVYLVKEAVSTGVNRNHTRVEEEDLRDAEKQYSHYAFDSILVENGITVPQLESLLYEFAGKRVFVTEDEVEQCIKGASLPPELKESLIDHLIRLTFLGIEVDEEEFVFTEDPRELKRNQILGARLARQLKRKRRFKIHPAFHSSCERGCQGKILSPPLGGNQGLVTYIQPCLLIRGAFDFSAFVRRVVHRRCQPQLMIPTCGFM